MHADMTKRVFSCLLLTWIGAKSCKYLFLEERILEREGNELLMGWEEMALTTNPAIGPQIQVRETWWCGIPRLCMQPRARTTQGWDHRTSRIKQPRRGTWPECRGRGGRAAAPRRTGCRRRPCRQRTASRGCRPASPRTQHCWENSGLPPYPSFMPAAMQRRDTDAVVLQMRDGDGDGNGMGK